MAAEQIKVKSTKLYHKTFFLAAPTLLHLKNPYTYVFKLANYPQQHFSNTSILPSQISIPTSPSSHPLKHQFTSPKV